MKQLLAVALGVLLAFFGLLIVDFPDRWPDIPRSVGMASLVDRRLREEDIRVFTDISYGEHQRHMLDVYAPAGTNNAPVLFFVHGGGWSSGDRSMYAHIGRFFSKHGFCTVVINHRLSPEVKHPDHTRDAAKAFAWVKGNIGRYGGNAHQISLMGHSSGAHITALLCSNSDYLEQVGCSNREVNRYVGISGVYKVDLMLTLAGYGHVFEKSDWETASPTSYMPACPCLLIYGEKDYSTMPRQTRAFEDCIKRHNGSVQTFIASAETHESIIINACLPDKIYNNVILDFLRS